MKLPGARFEELQEALVTAFPTESDLRQMVRVGLDVPLANISNSRNLRGLVYDLIEWAESRGRLDDLVKQAHTHNPGNELLGALAKSWPHDPGLHSLSPLARSRVLHPGASRTRSQVAVVVGALLALGALGARLFVSDRPLRTARTMSAASTAGPPVLDPTRSALPGARAVSADPELTSFFTRWSDAAIIHRGMAPLGPYYVERVQFRGSGLLTDAPAIGRYFSDGARQGNLFDIDWSHSEWILEPRTSPDASSACTDLPRAEGDILKIRAWAREYAPRRVDNSSGQVPCPWLVGRYLFRLRRVAGELRICHETWALREGICVSCPAASACRSP